MPYDTHSRTGSYINVSNHGDNIADQSPNPIPLFGYPDYQGCAALGPRARAFLYVTTGRAIGPARAGAGVGAGAEIQPMLSLMYFMHFHFMVSLALWSSERHVCSMTWLAGDGDGKGVEVKYETAAYTCLLP